MLPNSNVWSFSERSFLSIKILGLQRTYTWVKINSLEGYGIAHRTGGNAQVWRTELDHSVDQGMGTKAACVRAAWGSVGRMFQSEPLSNFLSLCLIKMKVHIYVLLTSASDDSKYFACIKSIFITGLWGR